MLLAISRICRLPFALINSNGILLIWLFTSLTVALFLAKVFHNSSDKLEIWLLFNAKVFNLVKLTPFSGSDVNLLLAAYSCVKEVKLAILAGSLVSSLSVKDKNVNAELFLNKSSGRETILLLDKLTVFSFLLLANTFAGNVDNHDWLNSTDSNSELFANKFSGILPKLLEDKFTVFNFLLLANRFSGSLVTPFPPKLIRSILTAFLNKSSGNSPKLLLSEENDLTPGPMCFNKSKL